MKLKINNFLLVLMVAAPIPASAISLQDLACGATICLTNESEGGSACSPYLDKYYSIEVKGKFGKVLSGPTKIARKQFLKLCKKKDGPAAVDLRK